MRKQQPADQNRSAKVWGSLMREKFSPKEGRDRNCFTFLDSRFWLQHGVTTDVDPTAPPSQGCYVPREGILTLEGGAGVAWWPLHSAPLGKTHHNKLVGTRGATSNLRWEYPGMVPGFGIPTIMTWAVGKFSQRRGSTPPWNPIPVVAAFPTVKCNSRLETILCQSNKTQHLVKQVTKAQDVT